MNKIPYNFSLPIPFYFEVNGWYTKCPAGQKNRIFINWAFGNSLCCEHSIEWKGKHIHLAPFEFFGSSFKCSEETGLSRQEFRERIDQALDEGILIKQPQSTDKFPIFKWNISAFLKQVSQKTTSRITRQKEPKRTSRAQKEPVKEPVESGDKTPQKEPVKEPPSYKSYKEDAKASSQIDDDDELKLKRIIAKVLQNQLPFTEAFLRKEAKLRGVLHLGKALNAFDNRYLKPGKQIDNPSGLLITIHKQIIEENS